MFIRLSQRRPLRHSGPALGAPWVGESSLEPVPEPVGEALGPAVELVAVPVAAAVRRGRKVATQAVIP